MNDNATGEVDYAESGQKAATPHPVREGNIDQHTPQHEKDKVALEIDPIGKGAGDECWRYNGEHFLEKEEGQKGNGRTIGGTGSKTNTAEKQVLEVADDAPIVTAKGQAETDQDP